MSKKRKANKELKKAMRSGTRKERKAHTKELRNYKLNVAVSRNRIGFLKGKADDFNLVAYEAARVKKKKLENVQKRAIKGLPLPDDLKKIVLKRYLELTPQIKFA